MNGSVGQFGDARLDKGGLRSPKRGAAANRLPASARGDRGGELQAGRFFANPKVTTAKLIAGWSKQSRSAVTGRHVLALQDTMAVTLATGGDSKSAKGGAKRRDLGQLNGSSAHGVLAHVMLVVNAWDWDCPAFVDG